MHIETHFSSSSSSLCRLWAFCLLLGIGMELRWSEANPVTLISQTVVCRPHRVIWPRCRWSLCCQTLSWKLFLPLSLQLLFLVLTPAQGFPIWRKKKKKRKRKKRISVQAGWFERTCLNLGVLSGGVHSAAFILFSNYISTGSYPFLCVAKPCPGLFCYFPTPSFLFPQWGCMTLVRNWAIQSEK